MTSTEIISVEHAQMATTQHPYSTQFVWPTKGRLKWLGGNLALDFPISEEVMNDSGDVFFLGLDQLLQRLDEFEGYRGKMPIKDNLIARCFSAYEYGMMTADERELFEEFVRDEIATIGHIEAARRLILS